MNLTDFLSVQFDQTSPNRALSFCARRILEYKFWCEKGTFHIFLGARTLFLFKKNLLTTLFFSVKHVGTAVTRAVNPRFIDMDGSRMHLCLILLLCPRTSLEMCPDSLKLEPLVALRQ